MKKTSAEIATGVISLYTSGLSTKKVGDVFNISDGTVLRILKDANIKTRTNTDYKIYTINENFFENIDSEIKAYLLGFLYADGNINKNGYYITIDLSEYDIEILELFIKHLEYNIRPKIYERILKDRKYIKLVINSKKMCSDLIKLGCIPNKTFLLTFPNINDNLKSHFIRGYFDGDGTVTSCRQRCYVRIVSTYTFLEELYKSLVRNCNIKQNKIGTFKNSKVCYLSISSKKDCESFYRYIYRDATYFLKRKYNKFIQLIGENINGE